MEQPIASGEQIDEGTELGDVHDFAFVLGAEFRLRWENDGHDSCLGRGENFAVGGGDTDDSDVAFLFDLNRGAGAFLEFANDLALGADDLTDLVLRNLDGLDPGGILVQFGTRLGDGGRHDLQNLEPGILGLRQSSSQNVAGKTLKFGVELQRSDHICGSCHLEVHVAKRVFRTEDVGEGHVLAIAMDQAHCDASHGGQDRNAGIHERQRRSTNRCHRRRAVRREHLRDETHRIREVGLGGNHRVNGLLSEGSVTDLTTLGTAHEAGLSRRERWEVVVVHVTLAIGSAEVIQHLLHLQHAQCRDIEDLGLSPLEQSRSMSAAHDANLGR